MSKTTLEDIRRCEENIRLHSTELRCELEELAELVRNLDEEYITPQGTTLDEYDVQDYADRVSEIENEYFTED